MKRETNNFYVKDFELSQTLENDWETLVRRAASKSARELTRRRRWEKRVQKANVALVAIGILLVFQFGFTCWVQQKLLDSTNAYLLTSLISAPTR